MKKQYIKVPIPEAISEDGGASILFVNKQTVPLDGAVKEALAGNYCTGQATLIRNFFFGIMQSMADGVRRDGHARQIANFLTVYPVFKGEVDLDRGYDPAVNGVMIRARLLNEMDLDITDWSFEDVTEGKRSFKLTSCSTGEADGEYKVGELGHLNGKDLPSTEAGEELRVHWEVEGTDKSGDIPAAKLSSEIDRIDIAEDALAELALDEYDGKTIVFTVRGNFSSAKISAALRAETPVPVPIEETSDGKCKVMTFTDGESAAEFTLGHVWKATGEGFYTFGTAPEGEWAKDEIGIQIGENYLSFEPTIAADHKSFTVGDPTFGTLPAGTYEDVKLVFYVTRDGATEDLEIPIPKLVVEA